MEAIVERAGGLDVHQDIIVACLLLGPPSKRAKKEIRTFRSFTSELEELRQWLLAQGVTHVGMESTGAYWVPVYAALEAAGAFQLIVGNAQHIKNVPGRKTDVKDAEWIADLVRHGLIRKSFVPPKEFRELRDIVRFRRALVQARTTECNRLLKLLETASIKLASVASDVFGVSGVLMLKALIEGKQTPAEMAQLAKKSLRRKIPELELALAGNLEAHHRLLLQMQFHRIEQANKEIASLEEELKRRLEPHGILVSLLMEIPGVDWAVAATLIAEVGIDMSVFPSERHLAAWAGVCPGNNESAGKKKKTVARKGNVYLKAILVQAAHAASKTKGTYLKDKFFRLKARRGAKRAALAIAHKILVAAYFMLRDGTAYEDLGTTYLDGLNKSRVAKSLVKRLKNLGFEVAITQPA
jgi:transposase